MIYDLICCLQLRRLWISYSALTWLLGFIRSNTPRSHPLNLLDFCHIGCYYDSHHGKWPIYCF